MSKEMKVNKEKWFREIGIGKRNKTLAACIDSLIKRKRGNEWNEESDAIDISISCQSEIKITKKVYSTDFINPALAENLDKQYRSYREAEKQLPH